MTVLHVKLMYGDVQKSFSVYFLFVYHEWGWGGGGVRISLREWPFLYWRTHYPTGRTIFCYTSFKMNDVCCAHLYTRDA